MNHTITTTDKDGNSYSVDVSKLSWRPSVYAIIIRDDAILLSPQWDGYDIPGGGVEINETLSEALIREVREETGYDVEICDFVTCEESFFKMPTENDEHIHSLMFHYTARVIGGELTDKYFHDSEKDYAKTAEWVPLVKLPELKFYSSVDLRRIINTVVQKLQS